MISDIFLYTIYGLVYTLSYPIRILADVSANSDLLLNISKITTYFQAIDIFFPVNVLIIIIGLEVSIEVGIFAYKVIMWVVKRFPTQS